MSRALKLLLFATLGLALLFNVTTFRAGPQSSTDGRAEAAVAPRMGPLLRAPAPRVGLAEPQLKPPSLWQRPKVESIITEVRRTEKGRQLYTLSGGTGTDTTAPSGSYAMLTPNEMGLTVGPADPERLAQGDLATICLTYVYPRRVQWDANVALCNAVDGEHRRHGLFAFKCDSPGWYAVSLHLENPTRYAQQVTNQLRKFLPSPSEEVIDDTRTILPGQQYSVAGLVEITAPGLYHFEWKASIPEGSRSSRYLLFRAFAVDKL